MEKDNFSEVLALFIRALNIPVTRTSIQNELYKHPQYNTLLGLSEVLDNWSIPNAAYKFEFDELTDVPVPFIAHCGYKEFLLVSQYNQKEYTVSNEKWTNRKIGISEFKKMYSGSILIAEKSESSGEKDYHAGRRAEIFNKLSFPLSITLLFSLFVVYLSFCSKLGVWNWALIFLLLLKAGGVITSVLLLIQSIDSNNPLIKKICGGDEHSNCNAILSSPAARVTGNLSWSEVGFFYFSGSFILLVLHSNDTALISALALLNLFCLPYTIYSIYYQWRIAKQWCIFCCTVQGILWLEFFSFLPYLSIKSAVPSSSGLLAVMISFALPVLVWIILKPGILKIKQLNTMKQQLRLFKYNANLFNRMLQAELKYALPSDEHSLIIGQSAAKHVITVISNPFCEPCSKAHAYLDQWLKQRNDIKLQILFATKNIDSDRKTKVAEHLMALRYEHEPLYLQKAVNEWYHQKNKNYTAWSESYPVKNYPEIRDFLKTQNDWINLTQARITPAIFINGRKLPPNYYPEDLKYLLA